MTEHPNRPAADARVLIVRLSSIGDVIHAMPAFQAVREALPDAHIGWVVESAAAPLVRCIEGLDAVHEVDVQDWRRNLVRPRAWRHLFRSLRGVRATEYDVALDLQGLLKSALVSRFCARRTIGMARADLREPAANLLYSATAPAAREPVHVTERAIGVVKSFVPIEVAAPRWPALFADSRPSRDGRDSPSREAPVLLHTFANWSSKAYPDQDWIAVAKALHRETGRRVLWLWGPGEEARARGLAAEAGSGSEPTPELKLPDLLALTEKAALVVGGDSAPLHLAVACGTPVVALFGPTDPRRLGPLREADEVTVNRLECSHCHRRKCPLGTNECLESISPDEIVRAALARLSRTGQEH
ncbi:MAG: lipopolysaccharide heptosyltransferase I [Acidobacteria bacterium]|nr:lipopolysaccharide heptosyltransferase I [Acidobacteriota bacterium]